MRRHFISFGMAVAGVGAAAMSVSCVRQIQPVTGIPPVSATAAEHASKRPATAMERQIQNATDAGEGDAVVWELRQKMAADPNNLAVRLELIDHYMRAGSPELALEHCRLAAAKFPDAAEVQLRMAKLLQGMKLSKQAASGLDAFLAAHPQKSPEYASWLGILRDDTGDWAAGKKAHRGAVALAPDRDSLHNNLGYNLLMQGKSKEAAAEFREALRLRPDSETARNNLGMALAAEPGEAVLHWQSVSDPATAHSNMAALLIRQKRYAEARRELDIALGYNKNHAAALANLQLVSKLDGKPAVIPIKPVETRWSKFRSTLAKLLGG